MVASIFKKSQAAIKAAQAAVSKAQTTAAKNSVANMSPAVSPGYSPGGGGGGSYTAPAAPASYALTLPDAPAPTANTVAKPAALAKDADDKAKADYWIAMDKYWGGETESALSYYNDAKRKLAQIEMQYPDFAKDAGQSQAVLNARLAVSEAERKYQEAKAKADAINVTVGVTTVQDGDNERIEKTYTITDDTGNTVSTRYSEDNGGMSASELRAKQEKDQQKALDASNARVQAEAVREVEEIQAGAERDYALGAAKSTLDAYTDQYNRNLANIDSRYAADKLQGNQDLLMASNETASNAVKNSREGAQILSQYNLGGSSLGGRLGQIASEAANNANKVAALTYNQHMREADSNYGDSRLELEDQNAAQQNAYNQSVAKATSDYLSRLGVSTGKNAEEMSQYANPDYWYGTMFDAQGNRLNSFADMDSQQMRDYATNQTNLYKNYMNQYQQQQRDYANQQTNTKASQYVSSYVAPAAKTYETGLKSYTPVNSNTSVGITQPTLEREKEDELL